MVKKKRNTKSKSSSPKRSIKVAGFRNNKHRSSSNKAKGAKRYS